MDPDQLLIIGCTLAFAVTSYACLQTDRWNWSIATIIAAGAFGVGVIHQEVAA